MTESMHIVTLKDTGHILAAVTLTTEGSAPDLKALVGSDFPLQNQRKSGGFESAVLTKVPIEVLELKSVRKDTAVIADPQRYVVDGGRIVPLPELPASGSITLRVNRLSFAGGTPETHVVTVLAKKGAPDEERRAQAGRISDTGELELMLAILPGESPASISFGDEFDLLTAVAGHRPLWSSLTAVASE